MNLAVAAHKILDVFRLKGLAVNDFIHFAEFGEAIVWEEGGIQDENVRKALDTLIREGHLLEMCSGLRLTGKGLQALDGDPDSG